MSDMRGVQYAVTSACILCCTDENCVCRWSKTQLFIRRTAAVSHPSTPSARRSGAVHKLFKKQGSMINDMEAIFTVDIRTRFPCMQDSFYMKSERISLVRKTLLPTVERELRADFILSAACLRNRCAASFGFTMGLLST